MVHPSGGTKQGRGGKTRHCLALNGNISKTVADTSRYKVTNDD